MLIIKPSHSSHPIQMTMLVRTLRDVCQMFTTHLKTQRVEHTCAYGIESVLKTFLKPYPCRQFPFALVHSCCGEFLLILLQIHSAVQAVKLLVAVLLPSHVHSEAKQYQSEAEAEISSQVDRQQCAEALPEREQHRNGLFARGVGNRIILCAGARPRILLLHRYFPQQQ